MIGDKAIRVGEKLPAHCQKMVQVRCDFSPNKETWCGATFWIIHEDRTADRVRADKQGSELKRILQGEHVTRTDLEIHQNTYELDD